MAQARPRWPGVYLGNDSASTRQALSAGRQTTDGRAEMAVLRRPATVASSPAGNTESAFGVPWIRIDDAELAIVAAFGLLSRSRVNMPIRA